MPALRPAQRHEAAAPRAARAQAARATPQRAAEPPVEAPKTRRASSQLSESLAPAAPAPRRCAPVAAAAGARGRPGSAGQRDEGHAPHARVAARDAGVERPVAPLADPGRACSRSWRSSASRRISPIRWCARFPTNLTFSAARRFALATIARTIQITGDRWLEKGGVVAFAGPAGAGKTTLLAKLAARWVLRHGPRRVALVSADAVRIGAHEQMHMLGRLLGVTTHNVFDVAELPELLYELRSCQFVMIDTAGASPRDPELARRLRLLNQLQASIETALVLPASTQAGAIDEVVQRFALAKPSACVITKVDEAVSLGGVLSALVRHKLPAAYISDGQRVPEDLVAGALARAGEPRGGNREPQRLDRRRRSHAAAHQSE